jgi:hypothetical protein
MIIHSYGYNAPSYDSIISYNGYSYDNVIQNFCYNGDYMMNIPIT